MHQQIWNMTTIEHSNSLYIYNTSPKYSHIHIFTYGCTSISSISTSRQGSSLAMAQCSGSMPDRHSALAISGAISIKVSTIGTAARPFLLQVDFLFFYFYMFSRGRYQYGDGLYAMLVVLQRILEEDQSCIMQHFTLHQMPTVQIKRPFNLNLKSADSNLPAGLVQRGVAVFVLCFTRLRALLHQHLQHVQVESALRERHVESGFACFAL